MLKVIDYGAGNLFSVANALQFLGIEFEVASDSKSAAEGDGILLPGVGAFPKAVEMLQEKNLFEFLQTTQQPLLGICLGMQLLFAESDEFGQTQGLGRIPGKVIKMDVDLPIPHMGWNKLQSLKPCPITAGCEGEYVYFVHSFRADCDDAFVSDFCDYGGRIPATVCNGNVFGCQFHPEKSGDVGLKMLQNFDAFTRRKERNAR